MESLRKELRYQVLSLTRLRGAMNELLQQKTVNIELVAKMEAIITAYYEPELRKLAETTQKAMMLLNAEDETGEDHTVEAQLLDNLDKFREAGMNFQAKLASYNQKLANERIRKSLAPAPVSGDAASAPGSLVGLPVQHQFTKIKEIEPPTFNGDLTKFFEWKNLFVNLIHNRPPNEMGNTLKLYYLKKSMTGEAEGLLTDFELSDEGYVAAWDFVICRFEKRRSIVKAFFRKLLRIEPVQSEQSLQRLLDTTNSIIRGLTAASENINDTFSRFLAFYTSTKLDAVTLKDWEDSLNSTDVYPSFEQLNKFVQCRAFAAEERQREMDYRSSIPKETKKPQVIREKKSFAITSAVIKRPQCVVCSQSHFLNQCAEFKSKSPVDRYEIVKKNRLCYVCFDSRHGVEKCRSRFLCNCGHRHSPLLHFDRTGAPREEAPAKVSAGVVVGSAPEKKAFACVDGGQVEFVVLPSAVVSFASAGVVGRARALLDSCSQPTLVSDLFVKKFRLPVRSVRAVSLAGVGGGRVETSAIVCLTFASRFGDFRVDVEADVVPASSMAYTANLEVPEEVNAKIRREKLADPAWLHENVAIDRVDLILGGKVYEKIIGDNSYWVGGLKLRSTGFGYTVAGVAPRPIKVEGKFAACTIHEIDDSLRKFWEVEEACYLPKEGGANACVDHFEENVTYAPDGKFMVRLPFQIEKERVFNNRERALASFFHLERKLKPELWQSCVKFLQEYIEAGHMVLAEPPSGTSYYIPYRPVLRQQSSTTPVRVVFNASSRKKGENSLNDALMLGPTIQRDLFDVLLSMRSHRLVLCADIKKMYRMVWVHPDDCDMQRVFFRDNPTESVKEYRLATLTYGTKPASFIATKCLERVAGEVSGENAQAAMVIKNCFYMDDLITGADSFGELLHLQKAVHRALARRGFELRKYISNSRDLMKAVPEELVSGSALKSFEGECEGQLVLGITWQPMTDVYGIYADIGDDFGKIAVTKRVVLSYASRIFDPMGLVAPVTIRGKLLLQTLWAEGKSWDEVVSDETASKFVDYMQQLRQLSKIAVPRSIYSSGKRQIFAFCDASEKAYCAVLYLRVPDARGGTFVRMICAKTRVAPIRKLTVPRLELAAACLLAELVQRVAQTLAVELRDVFAFSDSTVVLCWLSQPAENWQAFVANRVVKVLRIVPYRNWHYVNTDNNPADCGTRGLSVDEFSRCEKWFDGPPFLAENDPFGVFKIPNGGVENALERRKKICLTTFSEADFIDRFSSFGTLVRVVAYILRFVQRCRRSEIARSRVIDSDEFQAATGHVIKLVQHRWFTAEVDGLRAGEPIGKRSSLSSLDPWLDEQGIMRVGGRLGLSSFSSDKKYPIVLPARAQFAKTLCRYVHERFFHAGRSFLASFFSSGYWFVGGRTNLFKGVVRGCVGCTRAKARVAEQMMGQLPAARVSVAAPFAHCGVDLAGPFEVKCTGHRVTKFGKAYVAVFVCMTVRAVHIEMVSDLSTERFIDALQRFIARRGIPAVIWSDNGSNFKGARNFFEARDRELVEFAAREQFQWKFIPPRAPNFGGIWEAAVKAAKKQLLSVTHGVTLNYEEYSTLFTRIEAILNSRPLCYRKEAQQGEEVLTPAHFLIGRSMVAIPGLDNCEVELTRRFRLVQSQLRGFWSVWSKDYLNHLQQRAKWKSAVPNLTLGQVVLVRKENHGPFDWPLGVVVSVHPGPDGLVRTVGVKFRGSVLTRAVSSLVPLPVELSSAQPGEHVNVEV